MELIIAVVTAIISAVVGFYLGKLEKRSQIKVIASHVSVSGRNREYVETQDTYRKQEISDFENEYPGLWVRLVNSGEKELYVEDILFVVEERSFFRHRRSAYMEPR